MNVRILTSALVSSATGILPPFVVAALATQMQPGLNFSADGLGAAIATFFLAAGLGGALLGGRVSRWGWQSSMRIAATGTLVTLLGVASLVHSWVGLVIMMSFGGIWHAMAMPASNLALAGDVWPQRRAFTFGLRQAAVPTTMLFGGVASSTIAVAVGWRSVFVVAALFPLTAFALVPRRTDPMRPFERRPTTGVSTNRMVAIAVGGGFATAAVSALGAFAVLGFVESGMSIGAAGWLLVLASTTAIAARMLVGWWADRRRVRSFRVVSWMLLGGSVGYLALATSNGAAIVLGAVIAFGVGWGWPGLYHFGVVSSNTENPARATGIAQAGLSTGAALGPLVFGFAVEHTSLALSWTATAVVSAASGVLLASCLDRSDHVASPDGESG